MKLKIYLNLIILFIFNLCNGQNEDLKLKVDNLKLTETDFLNCDSDYWKIIAYKETAIPYLIDKLSDENITKAKHNCKTDNLKVGDVAYLALSEILKIPLYEVTKVQFDFYDNNGCLGRFFEYIDQNRTRFKNQINKYYLKNKHKLKFVKFANIKLTKCRTQNNIYGYYTVK